MAVPRCSYEPKKTNAYSEDLRWRMIWQSETLGLKSSEVAVNLGVDRMTVWRTVTLFRNTGNVQKKTHNYNIITIIHMYMHIKSE